MARAFPKEPTRAALQQSLPSIDPKPESTERLRLRTCCPAMPVRWRPTVSS